VTQPIRVAVVGLGSIGRAVYRTLAARQWVQIVAAVDVDPTLIGRDAGELAGADAGGVPVVASFGEAGTGGDVAIVCTGSRLEAVAPLLGEAVAAGWHVLSTCEELAFPWLRHREAAAAIDDAARAAGRCVLGTGVNPGFAMDAAVLHLSAVVDRVTAVEVERVVDVATRREALRSKVGLGISATEFAQRAAAGSIGHVGLAESAALVATAFSWPTVDLDESLEPVFADAEIEVAGRRIGPGAVLGIRQTATIREDGEPRVVLRLTMYGGAADPHDTVTLHGPSPITQRITGIDGDAATITVVVNTIPVMVTLPPGLVTVLDVAAVRARHGLIE
jgi:4-hydroxy-tetrahydrodipicolinate reductase